jgi:hypothetical protein|tara:strand:+ start:272 stop:430 length:159 start_codon:yes stop_codon:yes gene_type:complete
MEIKYICESCGEEIEFNKDAWFKHFRENHPKKVNVKRLNMKGGVIIYDEATS